MLAFPTGRLAPRPDRLLVRLTAAFVLIGPPLLLLFAKHPHGCGSDCGTSAIVDRRVADDRDGRRHGRHGVHGRARRRRRRGARPALAPRDARAAPRRSLPVYLAGGATLVVLLVSNVLAQISTDAADALGPLFLVLFAAVPFAFLFGILRSRLARGSVGGARRRRSARACRCATRSPRRSAIPTLELAFRLEEEQRFVDRDGRTFELPEPGSGRVASIVERDGRPVGALVHDESLCDEPELVESVAAAVALALDNERLEAELRAQYDYLNTIVDTAPSLLVTIDTEGVIRNLNPATVERERLRERATRCAAATSGTSSSTTCERERDDRALPRRRARLPAGRVRERLHERARRAARDRLAQRAAARRRRARSSGSSPAASTSRCASSRRRSCAPRAPRIVAAGDDERRRLERNLHDGAQQRLVALSLALRLAQAKVATTRPRADELLAGASEELAQALEELRELARGIHPAVLTDRGLRAALEGLAARTPLPVELDAARRAPARADRGGRLLRRRRGGHERGQARAGDGGRRARRRAPTAASWSRSPTTASAPPTGAAARASAASPTGSPRSTAG